MGFFKTPNQVQKKVLNAARKTPTPGLPAPPGMQRKSAPRGAAPAPAAPASGGMMRQGMREGMRQDPAVMMDPRMAEGGHAKKKKSTKK